jgi:hypothetical protein
MVSGQLWTAAEGQLRPCVTTHHVTVHPPPPPPPPPPLGSAKAGARAARTAQQQGVGPCSGVHAGHAGRGRRCPGLADVPRPAAQLLTGCGDERGGDVDSARTGGQARVLGVGEPCSQAGGRAWWSGCWFGWAGVGARS